MNREHKSTKELLGSILKEIISLVENSDKKLVEDTKLKALVLKYKGTRQLKALRYTDVVDYVNHLQKDSINESALHTTSLNLHFAQISFMRLLVLLDEGSHKSQNRDVVIVGREDRKRPLLTPKDLEYSYNNDKEAFLIR